MIASQRSVAASGGRTKPLATRGIFGCARSIAFDARRNQHRDTRAVRLIFRTVVLYQAALLQKDSDQDVSGGRDRKHEVSDRHMRSRPEGDHETQHDRMAHELIERSLREIQANTATAITAANFWIILPPLTRYRCLIRCLPQASVLFNQLTHLAREQLISLARNH